MFDHNIYQINNIISGVEKDISDKQCLLVAMNEYRVDFIKHTFYYQISTYLHDSFKWLYDKDVNNLEEMRRLKVVYELLLNELRNILHIDLKVDAVIPCGDEPYAYKIVFAIAKKTIAFIVPNIEALTVDNMPLANNGQLAIVNETTNTVICKSYEVEEIEKGFKVFVGELPARELKFIKKLP